MVARTSEPSSTKDGKLPVSWVVALHRALCLAGAVVVGAALLASISSFVGDVWARRAPELWVLMASQAAVVGLFIGYSRRRLTTRAKAAVLVLTTVGLVAAAMLTWSNHPGVSHETARLLPVQAVQAQFLSATIVLVRRRWVVFTIVASAALATWLTGFAVSCSLWSRLDECAEPAGFAFSALLLMRALRRGAVEATELSERRRDARGQVARQTNDQLADDEARRLVHDRVIGALALVESGANPVAAGAACAAALTELGKLDPTTTSASLRDALVARTDPRVNVRGDGWSISPPPRVVTALRDSADEAIRNAARHAGVDEVTVQLTSTRSGQAAVLIQDAGRGFDPDHTPGFGLSESIVARMGGVGGEAHIESAPGMGTTVRLLWPQSANIRRSQDAGILASTRRSWLYVKVMVPPILATLYVAVRRASETSRPLASIGIAAMVAAVLLAVAYRVGRARPTWLLVGMAVVFNSLATALALALVPDRGLLALDAWVVTGCSVIIAAIALESDLAQMIVLAAAEVVVIAAIASRAEGVGIFEPLGSIVQPIGAGVVAFVVGALLRRGSELVAVQEALTNAAIDESGWHESASAARRHYAEQLQANVAPFLVYCAQDRPNPSAALSERAAGLAAQCRDLLTMSGVMPPQVRAAVLEGRKQGVRVAIRDAPSVSPVAWALLEAALRHGLDADAITLIPARPGNPARVTVIPRTRSQVSQRIQDDLPGQAIWIEHTDVTTSFVLISPAWGIVDGSD